MIIWDILNKFMCKAFMSCKVTIAMLWTCVRTIILLSITINIFGYTCIGIFNIPMIWYNIIITGIISEIILVISITFIGIIFLYISESYIVFTIKVSVGRWLRKHIPGIGTIFAIDGKHIENLSLAIVMTILTTLCIDISFVGIVLLFILYVVAGYVWDYIGNRVRKYFRNIKRKVIFKCKKSEE